MAELKTAGFLLLQANTAAAACNSCNIYVSFFCSFPVCVISAPSPVSVVRKGHTGKSSIALSWAEPDRPNGIILEYEIKYFEKVIKYIFM